MGFITSIKTCFAKYFEFSGRATRAEFWWYVFFIAILGALLRRYQVHTLPGLPQVGEGYYPPLASLFDLATFIPLLTVGWRRMHDSGRAGWYILPPMTLYLIFILFGLNGSDSLGTLVIRRDQPITLTGPIASAGVPGFAALSIMLLVFFALMFLVDDAPIRPDGEPLRSIGRKGMIKR